MLELVGLAEYAERPVVQLSGGQMQRVALARSLVYQPQLLLLDEPLSNLDAKLRLRLRDDLRRIIKQTGVTALYVTHDQAEAVVLGDRIGVMRDGKLLQMALARSKSTIARRTCSSRTSPGRRMLAGPRRRAQRRVRHDRDRLGGNRLTAWLPAGVAAGSRVKSRCGPRTSGSACSGAAEPNTSPRASPASAIRARRRSTSWALGGNSKPWSSAPASRYPVGSDVQISLPPGLCWAYSANETAPAD